MSTLREALQRASTDIVEQLSADAVKTLDKRTAEVVGDLTTAYGDFFDILHDRVLNDPNAYSGNSFTPAIFKSAGIGVTPWHAVASRWFDQKFKAYGQGYDRSMNFYHGVTAALIGAGFTNKNRKGRFRKGGKRSNLPFDLFIQSLAAGGREVVEGFFGPLKVAYSIERPDKGKVQLENTAESIKIIRQWRPAGNGKKQVFASFMEGTIVRSRITAFGKIDNITNENTLIGYMIGQSGYKEQWFKITGGANKGGMIRPILTPLIDWYMKYKFKLLLEDAFK